MSINNKTNITTKINTNLPDNGSNYISAALLRDVLYDLNDSTYNLISDRVGLNQYNTGLTYNSGTAVIYNDLIYYASVSGTTTPGAFNPSEWFLLEYSANTDNFILKNYGIELNENKRVIELAPDEILNNKPTGFYQIQQSGVPFGLTEDYPVANKSLMLSFSSTTGLDSRQIVIPHDLSVKKWYIRKLNGTDWVEYDLTNTTYSSENGITKSPSNIFSLGGNISTVNFDKLIAGASMNFNLSAVNFNNSIVTSGGTDLYDLFALKTAESKQHIDGINTYVIESTSATSINVTSATLNNLNVSGNSIHNDLTATTLTGYVIQSGSTNLYDIFATVVPPASEGPYSGNSITGSILPISGFNISTGSFSVVAGGRQNEASGNYSSVVNGRSNVASGSYSVAEGVNTIAIGFNSHAEGNGTTSFGGNSHAEGAFTNAYGLSSHAEGTLTNAGGNYSHAEGRSSSATGIASHAEGSSTASGNYSHAEGKGTIASGNYSHAEGFATTSSGENSHTEGRNTTASGYYSHAEGFLTKAIGADSHSEGYGTIANGNFSHAEGYKTTTIGASSHAEGSKTTASGSYSHAEGYRTIANQKSSHAGGSASTANSYVSFIHSSDSYVNGINAAILGGYKNRLTSTATNSIILGGNNITGDSSNTVYGINFSVQGAISASTIYSGSTDLYDIFSTTGGGGSIGPYSGNSLNGAISPISGSNDASGSFAVIAGGTGNTASGNYSFAIGYEVSATGNSSHAIGLRTLASGEYSHAEGSNTTAFGINSHAEGWNSIATGPHSHAEGWTTTASGARSHSEGAFTKAIGVNSHAEGRQTTSSGGYSHSEGYLTIASGNFSHAEGEKTTASGLRSHAEGYITTASAPFTHAQNFLTIASANFASANGYRSFASGNASFAEGWQSSGTNQASHAEGSRTLASGLASHSEGYSTTASANQSHAEGYRTTASNSGAHAEGNLTIASGLFSHAEGNSTSATTYYTHAEGFQTLANGTESHAEGRKTIAQGSVSHAEGYSTTASGNQSHSEGYYTTASGNQSHAEGWITTATVQGAHAEGGQTVASGGFSHAEGRQTIASGGYSHSEGKSTLASGLSSHAGGSGSTANKETSFVHSSDSYVDGVNAAILGGYKNRLTSTATNSIILGGNNITGSSSNTVYMPNASVVGTISAATIYSGSTNLYDIFSTTGGGGGSTSKDYSIKFQKAGTLGYEVLKLDGFTNNMGWIAPTTCKLQDISLLLGDSNASANETITFSVRKVAVGVGLTGSVSQFSLGSGTLVAQISMNSGGALASRYYRNTATTENNITINAGDLVFVEAPNKAFWTINDCIVNLRLNR